MCSGNTTYTQVGVESRVCTTSGWCLVRLSGGLLKVGRANGFSCISLPGSRGDWNSSTSMCLEDGRSILMGQT